ncbi:MAG: single-stranded-DNA-specific exonuclease RecJ, partial [Nitrospirales bacterium]|nr:single-stranded-DNA-specific exonuclease RecJ [Nitrospirales bacterium]
MNKKKWLVNRTNPEYVNYLSRAASVSPTFAQVLISRGIKRPDQVNNFLNPDQGKLSDPFDLPGMKEATERILVAKARGERVLIHGDYDADGVSATSILLEGLRRLGVEAQAFIPNRISHGYGFGKAGVERAKEIGAGLIITVDCGITSLDAVEAAKARGIDVIITDHHEPGECLPMAAAVVNPKIAGE